MKIGVDGHPQGAYLGTWGIRNSLPEKATAPRWAGPGLSGHNPCSWGLDLHPTHTMDIRARPWGSHTTHASTGRELQSPSTANLSPWQLGRPLPLHAHSPGAQGPIASTA